MSSLRLSTLSQRTRHAVAWLLICLAPLQAVAASVFATLGPAHFHTAGASVPVLEDFRRAPLALAAPERHVASAFGHFHGAQTPLRHHHAAGTASVVTLSGDLAQHATDADETGAGSAMGAFVALIPSVVAWAPTQRSHVVASRSAWAPQTHHPEFPERPPRRAA